MNPTPFPTRPTFDDGNLGAFGDLIVAELVPVVQLDFQYGTNIQTGVSAVLNSATVDTDSGRLRLQTGTNSAGSAIFTSRKAARYRPGQGMIARFTPLFTTGVTNSTQVWGMFQAGFTDGYGFAYNGTALSILHRIRSSSTFIAQANWNGDPANGNGVSKFNWDPTKGTPAMIVYPYLGYGDIKFFLQNSTDGRWILVHTIQYANSVATTQVANPALHFFGMALNSGNTTNLTMYCGSVGVFITGIRNTLSEPHWSADNQKSGITTETNIITLKNASSFNGVANETLIKLLSVSFGSSANTTGTLRIKLNTTLGGTPSFTPRNGSTADNGTTITSGNSVASFDTAGTTITNGTNIFGAAVAAGGGYEVDLTPYELYVAPGEICTFSVENGANSVSTVCVNWSENV